MTKERERPDLVILDIIMPVVDGLEVLREIRKNHKTPVIMITAKSQTFDKVTGLELGADDFMVKPFDMKEFSRNQNIVIDGNVTPSEWSNALKVNSLLGLASMEDCPEKTELYFSLSKKLLNNCG